ncbi:TLR cluster1 member 3 [Biomphalaria glabrata]|uniref:Protein artichoke-like n=1 Tax=Biomphalaria glabrata TaxID=6526 RepID=A0A9U8ECF2_BIOGL|nr:protein artichoke-like [Biomphalaria glabrata]KAI8732119.1 toll-like receptor 4; transcript variant X1; misc_RNA Pattern recognition/Resistant factor [Biomphalaria glabrata]
MKRNQGRLLVVVFLSNYRQRKKSGTMFKSLLITCQVMIIIRLLLTNISANSTVMYGNDEVSSQCCTVVNVSDVLVVNCSSLKWTFVVLRCLPVSTEVLVLDHNNLTALTNGSFHTLALLRELSIKSSNVHRIEVDAFLGLSQLRNLNLENNLLRDDVTSLSPKTFSHLTNLKQLLIGYNLGLSKNVKDAFVYLRNLSTLSMDGSKKLHIGSEFSLLTNLYNFTLYCTNVTIIPNDSFVGLWNSRLKILNLIGFDNFTVDPADFDPDYTEFNDDALQNLNSLETLKIVNCRIGNENMARKFKHFINSSLHTLYLETTHYTRDFYTPNLTLEDGVILKSTAKYLSQLTLTHFSWVDSNIFAIAPGVVSSPQWRHNIQYLDFSKNMMGWLGWRYPLLEAVLLQKLKEIIITSLNPENDDSFSYLGLHTLRKDVPVPSSVCSGLNHKPNLNERNINHNFGREDSRFDTNLNIVLRNAAFSNATIINEPLKNYSTFETIALSEYTTRAELGSISERALFRFSKNPPYPGNSGTWTFRMPPALRVLKIMYTFRGDNNYGNQSFRFFQNAKEAANLTHFYFVGNSVSRCTGRIMGLTNLQFLDFSENSLMVSSFFFDDFPTVRFLILRSMKNEEFFQRLPIDRLIYKLTELRYLDLTDNKLNFLPTNLFARNPRISHVILSKNRFSKLPLYMGLVLNLEFLDLSGNAIIYLTQEEMSSLTKHSENVPEFYLALAENNIACVCSQIQFIFWLNISDFLDNKGNYSCTSQEGQLITTNTLLLDFIGFYRNCYGYNYLMISIVLLLVMSSTFLMAYLVHRFRTAIEAYLVRIFIKAFRPMKSSDYKTHVFIGYADDDVGFVRHILLRYLEETLKVTTFIHHRDLCPGYTDQQMFEAMRDSWRILLVITNSFLDKYGLSDIVMKYASHSVTPANQGRVVMLVLQTQLHNIPGYLYDVLEDRRIIVLSDLTTDLDYVQRQAIKECLRDT